MPRRGERLAADPYDDLVDEGYGPHSAYGAGPGDGDGAAAVETPQDQERHPVLRLRPGYVGALLFGTWAVGLAVWCAPFVPADRGRAWELAQTALGAQEERSLGGWWTTTLFALAAVALLGAAGQARRSRRPFRAFAWVLTALCMGALSVDRSLRASAYLVQYTDDRLPGPVGDYPVEAALAVLLVPAGLVLLARASAGQWLLLVLAPLAFTAGAVGIGGGLVELPWSEHHTALTATATQWAGVLLLTLAATLERRGGRSG